MNTLFSAHPFLSLAMDSVQEQMAIGSADGKVTSHRIMSLQPLSHREILTRVNFFWLLKLHLYDLTYNGGYRCLYELDVNQLMQKYWSQKETIADTSKNGPSFINSQPTWQSKSTPDEGNEVVLEPGMAVLAVCFITNPLQESARNRDAGAHRVLFGSHTGSAIK